jgi:hypothetical protein
MNAQSKIEPGTLYQAMALAFPEIEGATKDKNNPAFRSKYADLGSVVDAIKPALIKQGLFFTQHTHEADGGVLIETQVHHASGESMSFGRLFVPANKQDAQGHGSALTYARRYSLMTAFGVAPEDDDGNAAARSAPRPSQAAPAPISTGEQPVAKREKLSGPYTSKSTLWGAVRAFVHAVNGMGDLGELLGYLDTPDVKALLEQCERDAPGLLRDGLPETPEYVPMEIVIDQRKRELEQMDEINTRQRNPITAG